MMLTRNRVIFSMVGALIMLNGSADAARTKTASHTINGIVVNHKSKPVAGAHVHVQHHHAHHAAAAAVAAKPAKPKGAHAHHGIVTAANGSFSMKHRTGRLTLVAHKKHEGTGHARVNVGSKATANVTIRLHKHHHHHS